jgi:hypothetical protein
MTATNRQAARGWLQDAENRRGDTRTEDYAHAAALTGIGYALLEVADSFRDITAPVELPERPS